jgi:hypothetical protein
VSQRARRFWRGHSRSDNVFNVKEMSQDGGLQKKDAEGPCQIRVAPVLGFLGQGQSGVRSCSPVGSLGMTPVQQGDEINPLERRADDPREGSLYPPRRFGWDSSRVISQPTRSSSTGSPAPVAH